MVKHSKKWVARMFNFFHDDSTYEICVLFRVYAVRIVCQEEFFVDLLTLKNWRIACPETSVRIYYSTLRKIPKGQIPFSQRRKPEITNLLFFSFLYTKVKIDVSIEQISTDYKLLSRVSSRGHVEVTGKIQCWYYMVESVTTFNQPL
jgi:hypothetical protein